MRAKVVVNLKIPTSSRELHLAITVRLVIYRILAEG